MSTPKKKRYTAALERPTFRSEREEAEWWDSHREEAEEWVRRAVKAGAVGRGTLDSALATQRPATTQTCIRLSTADLERAKGIAHRKGIGYQTYLKMLIHEALQREAKAS